MRSSTELIFMYKKEITVPTEVSSEVQGVRVKLSGPKGSIEKRFQIPKNINIEKDDSKIRVSTELDERKYKALVGTTIAHIRNAIVGVTKGYVYKLKVIYSHFPITVKVEGDKFLIQNFMGERVPRVARIIKGAEVKVDGADIEIKGIDLDIVSQTASRIELVTRRAGYDKKIFQDGIYITQKGE